jgi:SAM-dependent methyltransferase
MPRRLSRNVGRAAFGADPAAYDAARPGYPKTVYATLRRRCGLAPGARVFEVGAGTGFATRELLRAGPGSLSIVEPDRRLARYLRTRLRHAPPVWRIVPTSFEDAELPARAFDLGVAATAFHWLDEPRALRKVARLLRPGGWWAMWWNVFGDPAHPSEFQRALDPLFRDLPSGPSSTPPAGPPFQLDRRARERALREGGRFRRVSSSVSRWTLELDTPRLRSVYATFSPIATLPARRRCRFLEEVGRIADERYGGRVTIRMLTPVYTAQRT